MYLNCIYFGLSTPDIGTLGRKYILFGYMDPEKQVLILVSPVLRPLNT